MTSSTSISKRLSDPEYKNWVLAGQGLLLVKDGIKNFCSDVIKTFHTGLQGNHSSTQCSNQCCISKNIEYKNKAWKLKNSCPSCEKWLADIANEHKQKNAKDKVYWQNSNVKDWPVSHWDVAKVYMERGQKDNKGPDESDLSSLLTLILNCKLFVSHLKSLHPVNQVKEARNKIMHSSEMKLSQKDKGKWIDIMIKLLEDGKELKNLPECMESVKALNELKTMDIDIDETKLRKLFEAEIILLKEKMEFLENSLSEAKDDRDEMREHLNKALEVLNIVATDRELMEALEDQVSNLLTSAGETRSRLNNVEDRVTAVEEQTQDIYSKMDALNSRVEKFEEERTSTQGGVPALPNYKNRLQEHCQSKHIDLPKYNMKAAENGKGWYCEVTVEERSFMSLRAHVKKIEAHQDAAKQALEGLGLVVKNAESPDDTSNAASASELPDRLEKIDISSSAMNNSSERRERLNDLLCRHLLQEEAQFSMAKKTSGSTTTYKARVSCKVPHVLQVNCSSINKKVAMEEAAGSALADAGWFKGTYNSNKEALYSECGKGKLDTPKYAHLGDGGLGKGLVTLVRAGCIRKANTVEAVRQFVGSEESALTDVTSLILNSFEELTLRDMDVKSASFLQSEPSDKVQNKDLEAEAHASTENMTENLQKGSDANVTASAQNSDSMVTASVPPEDNRKGTSGKTSASNVQSSCDETSMKKVCPSVTPSKARGGSPTTSSPKSGSNPKGTVLEYCDKHKLPKPTANHNQTNDRKFKCLLEMENIFRLDGRESKAKDAEKKIALKAMEKIEGVQIDATTAKNKLQEYTQKHKFPLPDYKHEQIGNEFTATVRVKFLLSDEESFATIKEAEKHVYNLAANVILH